jgi:hypothetical protein
MKILIVLLCGLFFTSCSTSIEAYKDAKPKLDMKSFFNGKLIAHGFYKSRTNHVSKTFVVKMNAYWIGDVCTLEEDFSYSDGTTSRRVWTITKKSEADFIGTAADVKGQAIGIVAGNALQWKYVLKLDVGDSNYDIKFDDWMYLIDENTIINQSAMSKFGVGVGEVTLSIRKI